MQVNLKFLPSYYKSNNFILKNSIYFMHIPKCGGTTIDHIFAKLSSILQNFELQKYTYKSIHNKKFFYDINLHKKNTFISGHLDFDFTKSSKNIFKCSIVRNPLDRVISHYKYSVFKKNLIPLKYTFEDFLKDEIDSDRDNLITRHFAGLLNEKKTITSSDKDIAIENAKNFDSINIMDNWDSFVSDILTKFHLPSILYSNFQQHNYNFNYNTTSKDMEFIQKFYHYDFEIYNYIKNNVKNSNFKINNQYNKKICIVSPYINLEEKLYDKNEIKKLIFK